jgi:hypothetical protein
MTSPTPYPSAHRTPLEGQAIVRVVLAQATKNGLSWGHKRNDYARLCFVPASLLAGVHVCWATVGSVCTSACVALAI